MTRTKMRLQTVTLTPAASICISPFVCSHLVQLVEVGRHQADQLTRADLVQDPAG